VCRVTTHTHTQPQVSCLPAHGSHKHSRSTISLFPSLHPQHMSHRGMSHAFSTKIYSTDRPSLHHCSGATRWGQPSQHLRVTERRARRLSEADAYYMPPLPSPAAAPSTTTAAAAARTLRHRRSRTLPAARNLATGLLEPETPPLPPGSTLVHGGRFR
jgi:hypothetical protein